MKNMLFLTFSCKPTGERPARTHLLYKIKTAMFCTQDGVLVALLREKEPDLITLCLQKEKKYGRGWQSPTMLETYPKLKQINAQ